MTPELKERLKKALREGTLEVESVNPKTGEVRKSPLKEVLRHETPHKNLVKITVENGASIIVTEDHSVFHPTGTGAVVPVMASEVNVGDLLVVVYEEGSAGSEKIVELSSVESEEYTYDLSVPEDENFVMADGLLAHNSYSIGGISLDIEKSSKYESLKSNAESQTQEMAEAKVRTTKILAGLAQPRFGRGVRSSFGSHVGRGVLSPRNFL